ncbi:hypothetical protein OG474_06350 [Kribbella sp. NBC_01505]|uniref:hypothetical protein n=1 Tax=Kribbella sp. NBC_01505 TaxID=2903580 RepID=UPI003869F61E
MRHLSLGMVALLGLGLTTAPFASAAPPAPPEPTIAQGNNWDVRAVAGGYQVTLRLGAPAPMRSALPLLAVDGEPVGVAKQSPDQRTLTMVTTDPSVLKAKDVKLVWSGDVDQDGKKAEARGKAVGGPNDAYWLKPRLGALLKDDPAKAGKFKVETSEYNLGDEAVFLPGLGQKSEVVGKVYTPVGAKGKRPFVLFLHGRHQYCYGDATTPQEKPWPCAKGEKPVPSYRGYDGAAQALASNGYQVVSISSNAVNAYDGDAYDAGAQARAELVLHHLELWKKWSTTGGEPFGTKYVGKVDLQNVGLMGHSRGGEGVARAAIVNADRGGQFGIRAVLPLAPVDFARSTVPGVAMSVILPTCDGDVSDLQGQKFYDDTRYSVTGDAATRSTVTVLGANHNFFNTEWTPGQSEAPSNDDWGGDAKASPCGEKYAGRLKAKEQQAVGTAYLSGFFRLHLGNEKQFLPMFDGSDARAASAGRAVVRVVAQAPLASRRDVNRFDQALPEGAVSGKASSVVCAGARRQPSGRAAGFVPCLTTDGSGDAPHWDPAAFAARTPTLSATRFSWRDKTGVLHLNLPAAQRDVSKYAVLGFRTAPDPAGTPTTDLSVRVIDGKGHTVSVAVSKVSDALMRMPGPKESGLPKNLLRSVQIPLSSLKGLNLKDVRAIELRSDKVAKGTVYLSDLAFSSPGVGVSAPAVKLVRVSASDIKVKEGDKGTQNLNFVVRLNRASARPVKVYAETSGEHGATVGDVATTVVFKPGQVRRTVSVPVEANTRDSYDLKLDLVLSVPQDALLDKSFGHGEVVDDDPTPTLTVGNLTTAEKNGEAGFPLKLSAPSDKYVSVTGSLKDGTAVLKQDFVSTYEEWEPGSRTIDGSVEPGQTTGTAIVNIVDDKVKEPTETFSAVFDQVDGGEIKLPVTVTGTITDND